MTVQDFRKIFDNLTPHGWLSMDEALMLVDWAERTQGTMIEVGSYYGRSAMLLGQLQREIYCIDSWGDEFNKPMKGDEVFRNFLENIYDFPHIHPVRMKVENWEPIPAEFVYLDGDHSYEGTMVQIRKVQKCKPKAILVHDVNDSGGGVDIKRACLETLGDWNERVERLAAWSIRP